MLITEFRIPLPFSLDEYNRGIIYTTIKTSMQETRGEEGVEIIENEPYQNNLEMPSGHTSGQYTLKVYNFFKRFPCYIRALAPKTAMLLHEESWNSYPYCRTVITNPVLKGDFYIKIESLHCEGRPNRENAHQLSQELLDLREVILIDIANDPLPKDWTMEDVPPSQFASEISGRGPLGIDWIDTVQPMMTCYKLVQTKFKWFGLQKKIEAFIMKTERKLFTSMHRQMYVWTDDWFDLTMEQLKLMERDGASQLAPSRRDLLRNMSRYTISTYAIS